MYIKIIKFSKIRWYKTNERNIYCNMLLGNNAYIFSTNSQASSIRRFDKYQNLDYLDHSLNIRDIDKIPETNYLDTKNHIILKNIYIDKKFLKLITSNDREIRNIGLSLLFNKLKEIKKNE